MHCRSPPSSTQPPHQPPPTATSSNGDKERRRSLTPPLRSVTVPRASTTVDFQQLAHAPPTPPYSSTDPDNVRRTTAVSLADSELPPACNSSSRSTKYWRRRWWTPAILWAVYAWTDHERRNDSSASLAFLPSIDAISDVDGSSSSLRRAGYDNDDGSFFMGSYFHSIYLFTGLYLMHKCMVMVFNRSYSCSDGRSS